MRHILLITIVFALLFSASAVIAPTYNYYASGYGGNWSNAQEQAIGAPDNQVAWDLIDNNKTLYTYGFAGLPGFGQINSVWFSLRSNNSAPDTGNDELTLKYSVDGTMLWKNLDGQPYDGTSIANQSATLRNQFYTVSSSLDWSNLSVIYLGVEGKMYDRGDGEIFGIDSIWLRINFTDPVGPAISLHTPQDGSISTTRNVTFFYNATDLHSGILNCSLILNGLRNSTNYTITESVLQNFTLINMTDSIYNWSINCTDDSESYNTNASESRILYVDSTPPVVGLQSPTQSWLWNTSTSVVFNYNVSNPVTNVTSCSLILNGTKNGVAVTLVPKDATQNFTRTLGNANYNWSVNCTDAAGWEGNSTTFNLSVAVYYPNITSMSIPDPISLVVGGTQRITCNASITDLKGIGGITSVNASFYDISAGATAPDSNSDHYTNTSCTVVATSTYQANYTCGFALWYYANNATWICNISAVDVDGLAGSMLKNTTVNELYGVGISPYEINYTNLMAGTNSTDDVNITLTNLGNMEIDITLYGYANTQGDGLSMDCNTGTIPIEREHYSLLPQRGYSSMYSLSSTPSQLDAFNLAKQTADGINSTKSVFWKMGVPTGVDGDCYGNVVVGVVIS